MGLLAGIFGQEIILKILIFFSQYTLATSQMYGPHSCRTWLLHQVIDLSLTTRVTRIFGMSQLLLRNKDLLQNSALRNLNPIQPT